MAVVGDLLTIMVLQTHALSCVYYQSTHIALHSFTYIHPAQAFITYIENFRYSALMVFSSTFFFLFLYCSSYKIMIFPLSLFCCSDFRIMTESRGIYSVIEQKSSPIKTNTHYIYNILFLGRDWGRLGLVPLSVLCFISPVLHSLTSTTK